jgi:hypothetical protein
VLSKVTCVLALLALAPPIAAGQLRVTDPFDGSGKATWSELAGQWQVRDGVYHFSGNGQSFLLDTIFDDVSVEVSCHITRYLTIPQDWVGIMFGGDGRTVVANNYQVYIRYTGEVELYTNGKILEARKTGAQAKFAAGQFVRLAVTVKGGHFSVRVDGETLIDYDAPDYRPGTVGLAGCDVEGDFDDFVAEGHTLGNSITGEVLLLPSQTPVPGARADIYNSTDNYNSLVTRTTVADAQGRFTFADLPAGEKAYWLRTERDGYGGTTGWFVSVNPNGPTTQDLYLLGPPRHDLWIDSADMKRTGGPSGSGFQQFPEPQCFGGGRIQVKESRPASGHPQWWAEFEFDVPREADYVPYFAAGLYPTPHFWSDYWWSIDGAGPFRASKTLTIDGPRYGDRGQMTWAYALPLRLRAGRHTLRFILHDTAPHALTGDEQDYWWSFDAAAFAEVPAPLWPAKGRAVPTARPEIRWLAPKNAPRFTVQISSRPDFSNGTVTVGGVTGDRLRLGQALADGTYYWRLKALTDEETLYTTAFSQPQSFTVATPAPAISDLRVTSRTSTAATIEWTTDEPCTGRLRYGLSGLQLSHAVPAENAARTTYRARLTGLSPMTYYYFAAEATSRAGRHSTSLRHGFCTPRGVLGDRNSPFGIFGQGLTYSKQLGAAGARWYSDYWDWGAINPARGVFNWDQAEKEMQRARESGVNLMATFWGTPAWVRPSHPDDFTFGPDDLDDARSLFRAVADHCRGRADWWLPWIEPNVARDMVFGFPRGYWASRPHARSFAAYQRAAYEGFKAGDPDCHVVGIETAGVDLDFIRKCYDEGAADSFDVMNVHYYAITAPFEEQQPEALFGRLRALMSEYGDSEKPILCSEGGGASSGLEGTTEETQADSIVRIFVLSIANNIDKLCWTFELDEKPYGSKRVDMIMWMGLFRFDPRTTPANPVGEPKPSYFAFRTMTENLYGTEYVGPVKLGPGVRAYRFLAPQRRVTVLWAEKGTADTSLLVRPGQVTLINRQGATQPVAVDRGQVKLHLTGSPLYVQEG